MKKIAVFFGGISPEHDVSVVSALQVMDALDPNQYEVIPVYVSIKGQWWTGDLLRSKEIYLPNSSTLQKLTKVNLDLNHHGKPRLISSNKSLLGNKQTEIDFDVAMPIFHGLIGEDGNFQGLLETANIPYTGMRTLASAVTMDKVATKQILEGAGVPMLSYRVIKRPDQGLLIDKASLEKVMAGFEYPGCVKPVNLGSSIGVARVENIEELEATLPEIFKFDNVAMVEPFVKNLKEINVAVRRKNGEIITSAFEVPKFSDDLLDFKDKYMSGSGSKSGSKSPGQSSEGMLSLTRELNPDLGESEAMIREIAVTIYDRLNGSGAPRLDFVSDSSTGEIWFNELNPMPGSYGFFLWEASPDATLFTELLDDLINEALVLHASRQLPVDPAPEGGRLFKQRG